jgi:AcrR family transcriptional regulator
VSAPQEADQPDLALDLSDVHHQLLFGLCTGYTLRMPQTPTEQPARQNTKNRILIAALALFNEQGEAKTTTNQIADEVDISPGNLHYHFRTKAALMAAIIDAFEFDTRAVILPPGDEPISIDDIWLFLHVLLERLSLYRFIYRDFETIITTYPEVKARLRRFVVSLTGNVALHLLNLEKHGVLKTTAGDRLILGRSIVVQTLFSERFDALTGVVTHDDHSIVSAAQSVLHLLLPYLRGKDAQTVQNLIEDYR